MTRGIHPAHIAQMQSGTAHLAHALHLGITPAVYAWTGTQNVVFAGNTYVGFGEFSVIESVSTERSQTPTRLNVGIHGVPSQAIPGGFVRSLHTTWIQGKTMTLYGVFVGATGLFSGSPFPIWSGFIDSLNISAGATVSIILTGEHYSSLLRRPGGVRSTLHSHNEMIGRETSAANADMFFQFNTRLGMRNARRLT